MFHLLGFYQPYLNKDLMAIQATTEFIYQDLIGICKNKGSISAIRSYRTLRRLFLAVLDAQTQDAGYAFSSFVVTFASIAFMAAMRNPAVPHVGSNTRSSGRKSMSSQNS